MSPRSDLTEWAIVNPDNYVDQLPAPYNFIVEVLEETILHKLNLALFHIESKRADPNFENTVKEHVASTQFEIDSICCLSSTKNKPFNVSVVGDKAGAVYLLDLPKRAVLAKKDLASSQHKRVIHLSEFIITDGSQQLVTVAVTLNMHHEISILRYETGVNKLQLLHTVCLPISTPDKLPYESHLHDYGRLLVVMLYDGTILGIKLPDLVIKMPVSTTPIKQSDEELLKQLRDPFEYIEQSEPSQIKIDKNTAFQIKFEGYQQTKRFKDVLSRILKQQNAKSAPPAEADAPGGGKKDSKAPPPKDPKKPDPAQTTQPQKTEQASNATIMQFNQSLTEKQLAHNGSADITETYPIPNFKPFFLPLHTTVQMPKKKYFEKAKTISLLQKAIIGWTNTKEFVVYNLRYCTVETVPNHIWCSYFLQPSVKRLKEGQPIKLEVQTKCKNIFETTCLAMSNDESKVAFGMIDGSTAVWDIRSALLEFNADRHPSPVTCVEFFEGWKLISGCKKGHVHIDNVISATNQLKRTHTFEPKTDIPIVSIQVNNVGLALALDSQANIRIYDLWRNEKVCRFKACSSFAMVERRGKQWMTGSYSILVNWDFIQLISVNSDSQSKTGNQLTLPTNLHLVRVFELLLSLFEGLESTYKRGYDRKKVENLFSNLEYAQLYNREFIVPDFGRSLPQLKQGTSNNLAASGSSLSPSKPPKDTASIHSGIASTKNANSGSKKFNMTQKTVNQPSNGTLLSSKTKPQIGSDSPTVKLTDEILHPQKQLLERRRIPKNEPLTTTSLLETIRNEHNAKSRRESGLTTDMSKSIF